MVAYGDMVNMVTRQDAWLTRTGVWQAGTRRLKVLNAGTFLHRNHELKFFDIYNSGLPSFRYLLRTKITVL